MLRVSGLVAIMVGVAVGAVTMYAAWDHNPAGEIHGGGVIHWGHWLSIGALWFIAAAILIFFVFGIIPTGIVELGDRLRRRRAR